MKKKTVHLRLRRLRLVAAQDKRHPLDQRDGHEPVQHRERDPLLGRRALLRLLLRERQHHQQGRPHRQQVPLLQHREPGAVRHSLHGNGESVLTF